MKFAGILFIVNIMVTTDEVTEATIALSAVF
jgi:hypothetical protein